MCELKKYHKKSNTQIDKCMKNMIYFLKLYLQPKFEVLACCCGHGKYPMTIICREKKLSAKAFDLVSDTWIPRKRNFYVKKLFINVNKKKEVYMLQLIGLIAVFIFVVIALTWANSGDPKLDGE